ncbi:MAG: hypothetical protein ACR2GK_00040 [Gemmatimonadaceae bacterium]
MADSAAIANYVIGRTRFSPITVRPTWENVATKAWPTYAQVQVSYVYVPIVPLLPTRTITSRSRQTIAY